MRFNFAVELRVPSGEQAVNQRSGYWQESLTRPEMWNTAPEKHSSVPVKVQGPGYSFHDKRGLS